MFSLADSPSSALVRFALVKFAPVRFTDHRYARVRFAPVRLAPVRLVAKRNALSKFAPFRFAPVRFASDRPAMVRFAPVRFAPVRFASLRSSLVKTAKDLSQPLQSTLLDGGALHFDAVTAVADTLGVPAEVDADGLGAAIEAEGVGEVVDAEGVVEAVDAVGLDVLEQYSPGLQGVIVAVAVGQYAPGLQGAPIGAESVADGVGASTDAEGASDALPVATAPFNMVRAPLVAMLTGAAPSLPPQPARTSAPTRSATPAAALLERRAIAVTSRTAYPQSPALQPDEKPVRRLGS